MNYSLLSVGDWSYFTLKENSPTPFTYGFFTKKGPDFKNAEHSKLFLKIFSLKRFVIMKQEHGDTINVVKDGENPSSGDALVILEKNVAGLVKSADCIPIIILDTKIARAAIIHAGYRGTLKRLTEKTLKIMKDLGSEPGQIKAILGPSIGKCCYNVGEEVYMLFKNEFGDDNLFAITNGQIYLDLKRANISMLTREGVTDIHSLDLCTSCHNEIFYSYRKGDKDKRQVSFVCIRDVG